MKVFSKKKYLAQPISEYSKKTALRSGWVDECDGKPVIDGRCGCFVISDNWCIDVPGKKKGEKKMYTMKDFIEEKIAVRTGTGEKQRKFLELCEKAGLMWMNAKATEVHPNFYGEECCITYGFHDNKKLEFCEAEFYKDVGWQIVEYRDIAEAANSERYEIKISVDGDLTTAKMIVDGKTVKTATAKRNPADKFNFKKGAELAFARLFAKKVEEKDDNRPLRVGDRVVCKAPTDGKQIIVGVHGRIVTAVDPTMRFGVDFDKFIRGHSCGGNGKFGYCWTCKKETLVREKSEGKMNAT